MTSNFQDKPGLQRETGGVGNRVATSVSLLWSVTMLTRGLQLVTTAVLARLLTPGDYGLIAMATVVAGFIDLLSNLQVGGAVMRTKEITENHLASAFTVNLIRGLGSVVLLLAVAYPAATLMHEPRLAPVLAILSLSALMGCLHNPYFLLYARNINYRREALRNASGAIFGSLAGVTAALWFHSYWALVVASLTTSFVAMSLSYWRVPGLPRLGLSHAREFISFGGTLLLINVAEYINSKVDYFLVGRGLGDSALGAYHVGQQVTTMVTGDIVGPINQALIPAFSIVSHDAERLRFGYRRLQSLTVALALPVGFGASMLADDIIRLLVGRQWEMAIPVIRCLAPLAAINTMIYSIESLALATNNGRLLVIRTFIFLAVRATLMVVGFYLGGYLGIIHARVISGAFFVIYGLTLAGRITGSRWYEPVIMSWRSFLSLGAMIVILSLLSQAPLIPQNSKTEVAGGLFLLAAKVLAGGLSYVAVHLALWRLCKLPDGAERTLQLQLERLAGKVLSALKRQKSE